MKKISYHQSIFDAVQNFDALLVDLWGVIHDGEQLYPGVIETLKKLKGQKKKIIFLSNAPRRSSRVIEVLNKLGIEPEYYDHAVSSGEVTFLSLTREKIGEKYFYIGPERDAGILNGSGYERTKSVKDADFAIVTGFDEDNSVLDEKMPELKECLAAHLTLICANPDMEVVRLSGARALCSGVMAEAYYKMGGKVIYFGKPHPAVYERCFEILKGIDKSRIAAIGDNLDTDIKGANNIGIHSILVAGGVLADKTVKNGKIDQVKLEEIISNNGNIPDSAVVKFG